MPVQGDGDLVAETPVEMTIARGVIRVVVPEPAPAAEDVPAASDPSAERAAPVAPITPAAPSTSPAAAASPVPAVRRSMRRRLGDWDAAIYLRINRLHAWPAAERLAAWATRSMDHGELWVAVAFVLAIFDPAKSWRDVAAFVAALWGAELLVNYPIKSVFHRERPFVSYADARVLGRRRPLDWSFPSGHAATAFAGAALLGVWTPILAPFAIAYACVVGIARVYLGVHYPADVALGGLFGAGIALLLRVGTGVLFGVN
jgi:undecaprenyl-diphosphatase